MAITERMDDVPVVAEAAALTAASCLFHGFSDPSRLTILSTWPWVNTASST